MDKFYIYFLRRPDRDDPFEPSNGQPFYVGKGSNGRHLDHRKEATSYQHKPGIKTHKIHIIHFLWKQGLDFIEDIIFDNLTEQDAFDLEIEAIAAYGRVNSGTGILANLTDGGDGCSGLIQSESARAKVSKAFKGRRSPMLGRHHTDEVKKRIGDAHRGAKNHNFGKTCSIELKQKLRDAYLGKPLAKEHCKNISKALTGVPKSESHRRHLSEALSGVNGPAYGKPQSIETRLKMSLALQGHPVTPATRAKLSITKIGSLNPQYGKPRTDDEKRRISETLKARALLTKERGSNGSGPTK